MPKGGPSAEKKLKAIEKLVRHGRRGSEWQEAGLLRAIEKILDGEASLDSKSLERLMDEAAKF